MPHYCVSRCCRGNAARRARLRRAGGLRSFDSRIRPRPWSERKCDRTRGLDRQTSGKTVWRRSRPIGLAYAGDGAPLEDAISANGGSITFTVEPRDVRFYLEGLTGSYGNLDLFRTALNHPDFSAATLGSARGVLNQKIVQDQRLALNVGINMLNRAFYQNSNAGMPPYGIAATLAGFALLMLRRSTMRITCATKRSSASSATCTACPETRMRASFRGCIRVRLRRFRSGCQILSTSRQLIARRDVPVPWLVAQYAAPDLRSKDFGAMLILTAFVQRTLADVSSVPAIATGSRGLARRRRVL